MRDRIAPGSSESSRVRAHARGAVLGLAVGAMALIALGGCGSSGLGTPGGAATQSDLMRPVVATSPDGSLRTTVDHPAGSSLITVTVRVAGPAHLQGGCEQTLEVALLDSSGAAVPRPSDTGIHCLAITVIDIPAGQTRDFSAQIPVPPTPGSYIVTGSLRGGGAIPTAGVGV